MRETSLHAANTYLANIIAALYAHAVAHTMELQINLLTWIKNLELQINLLACIMNLIWLGSFEL
jgi:hypothetical protein